MNANVSMKRKTECDTENMYLNDENETLLQKTKRVQYDQIQPQPPHAHTVIEVMPASEIKTDQDATFNDPNVQQQFIELANVAFEHQNFINVESMLHPNQTTSAPQYTQIWNGGDLIVLENCNTIEKIPSPPLLPPSTSQSHHLQQHHHYHQSYHLQEHEETPGQIIISSSNNHHLLQQQQQQQHHHQQQQIHHQSNHEKGTKYIHFKAKFAWPQELNSPCIFFSFRAYTYKFFQFFTNHSQFIEIDHLVIFMFHSALSKNVHPKFCTLIKKTILFCLPKIKILP